MIDGLFWYAVIGAKHINAFNSNYFFPFNDFSEVFGEVR